MSKLLGINFSIYELTDEEFERYLSLSNLDSYGNCDRISKGVQLQDYLIEITIRKRPKFILDDLAEL